jgi:hypothetical protein
VSEDIIIIEKAAVAIEKIVIIVETAVVIAEIAIITEEVAVATDIINVHHLVEVTTTNAEDAVAANPYSNG